MFVIAPVFVVLNTPVLKQFYCEKAAGTCILRTYNMLQSTPVYDTSLKLKEISAVKNDNCKTFFGIYKEPCVILSTKSDKNYLLNYTFKNNDEAIWTAKDFKKFLVTNDKKHQKYKMIAEKAPEDCTTLIALWGIIMMFGLLISLGVIKETKPGESRKKFKAIWNKIKEKLNKE
jgi:hypothetical protein